MKRLNKNKIYWFVIAVLSSISALLYQSCRPSFYFIDEAVFKGVSLMVLALICINFLISISALLFKNKFSDKLLKTFFIISIVLTVIGVAVNVGYAFMGWEMWYDFRYYIIKALPYFFIIWWLVVALVIIPKLAGKTKQVVSVLLVVSVIISCVCVGFKTVKFEFSALPTVFIKNESEYSVVWATSTMATGYLEVNANGKTEQYIDEEQGNVRTNDKIHRITVPQKVLNNCENYRVKSTRSNQRTGYSLWSGKTIISEKYKFKTVADDAEKINILSFSDWHEHSSIAEKVAENLDKPDIFVMLGDAFNMVNDENSVVRDLLAPCGKMSGSSVPVIFARGNHECRGEHSPELLSTLGLESYYFKYTIGSVSGLVLDLGECYEDSFVEYCGLADYKNYRNIEEEWLKNVEVTKNKYNISIIHDDSFVVIEHNREDRSAWVDYLNEKGTELLLVGHLHEQFVREKGKDNRDFYTFVDGGIKDPQYFGSEIKINGKNIKFKTVDKNGKIMFESEKTL